jgi:hypothetical protein
MSFIQGEARTQGTLFPLTLDELIPQDHVCRVIDAFVDRLDMAGLGLERAEPGDTGRPGYDPRDLLKLYLYGYLQRVRSSRRLENECRRNVEVRAAESPSPRSQKHRRVPARAQRGSDAGGSGVDSLCAFSGTGTRGVDSSGWSEVSDRQQGW